MFLKNTQNSQGSTYARVSNSAILGRANKTCMFLPCTCILYNSSFSTSMLAGCQICQQELSKFTNIVANLLQTAMSLPRLFYHCHSLSQNQYLRLIIFLHRYLLLNKHFCIFLAILPDCNMIMNSFMKEVHFIQKSVHRNQQINGLFFI